ncbi:reverse transcriptase domain-containing protein [Tanacetum coccineum]
MFKDLGYIEGMLLFMHFRIPRQSLDGGLLPLMSEEDVIRFLEYVLRFREAEVYIETGVSLVEKHLMERMTSKGKAMLIEDKVDHDEDQAGDVILVEVVAEDKVAEETIVGSSGEDRDVVIPHEVYGAMKSVGIPSGTVSVINFVAFTLARSHGYLLSSSMYSSSFLTVFSIVGGKKEMTEMPSPAGHMRYIMGASLEKTVRFHCHTNGLVERANRSLGEGIKARLEARSKNWMEELPHVLWAHRTMIKSSNGDTLFSLTYGTEAVIPAEIGMPTIRTTKVDLVQNNEALEINLDLLEEKREEAAIREAKSKAKMENTIMQKFKIQVSNQETLYTTTMMQAEQKTQGS